MSRAEPERRPKPRVSYFRRVFSLTLLVAASVLCLMVAMRTHPEWFMQVKAHYGSTVSDFINDPENEHVRAELIERLVNVYRETPAGKSLALRDQEGRVVGRFRIGKAEINQVHQGGESKSRRRFHVAMAGTGEMWHEQGGRVRFNGGAEVTYEIDFYVRDLTVYTYFACVKLHHASFEVTQVDNLLAKLFASVVNDAGQRAVEESVRPGFTIITRDTGESWIAMGRVGREFVPRKGPYEEFDRDCDTICNDISFLNYGFRDYLGPFEMYEDDQLRVLVETKGLNGRESPGVDLFLVSEENFGVFEKHYPDDLGTGIEKFKLEPIVEYNNTRELKFTGEKLKGRYYLIIDRTPWGRGNQIKNEQPAEVRYYGRIKRG